LISSYRFTKVSGRKGTGNTHNPTVKYNEEPCGSQDSVFTQVTWYQRGYDALKLVGNIFV